MMKLIKIIVYTSYALSVFYVVFIGGNEYRHFRPFTFEKPVNLFPFSEKWAYIKAGDFENPREVTNLIKDVVGNLVLPFPFSIFLMLGENINVKKTLLLAFICSVGIEITQYLFSLGEADVDDIILNTTGALLGILLSQWVKQSTYWRQFLVP